MKALEMCICSLLLFLSIPPSDRKHPSFWSKATFPWTWRSCKCGGIPGPFSTCTQEFCCLTQLDFRGYGQWIGLLGVWIDILFCAAGPSDSVSGSFCWQRGIEMQTNPARSLHNSRCHIYGRPWASCLFTTEQVSPPTLKPWHGRNLPLLVGLPALFVQQVMSVHFNKWEVPVGAV